uniref:Uncharacterized protein n=1 Tax=Opuntia streptacantha TaxID=393608 RepID=A0A7C9EJE1_OPUST
MPMYWPGFYGPPNGLPHLPQQSLLRPPPGLSVPPSLQQQMQYSGFNSSLSAGVTNLPGSKLPDIPPSLVTSSSTSTVSTSVSLPQLHFPPMPSTHLASETLSSSAVPKALNSVLSTPTFPIISPLSISVPDAGSIAPAGSDKSNAVPSSSLQILGISQTTSSVISSSAPSHLDAPTPSLLTPDQLQSGQTPTAALPSEVADKDVEVVQVSSSSSSEPKVPAAKEAQPPILPLPPASKAFRKVDICPTLFSASHALEIIPLRSNNKLNLTDNIIC